MKVGIMQPYFVPYIGYWQLLNAVDKYVIYDDVNYINRGWINRNRIMIDGQPKYINVPMLGASQNKLINEIHVNNDPRQIKKNLRTIESAYKNAPYYAVIFPLVEEIIKCSQGYLASYIENSIRVICQYLEIETDIIVSSSVKKDCSLKGQDKILSICELLGATEYYNAVGGQMLYSYEDFRKRRIELKFLKTNNIKYKQFGNDFLPNLSIIDVMMFNSGQKVKEMLEDYSIICENEEIKNDIGEGQI